MGAMNSNYWLDNGTDIYPIFLRNILANKLGTATAGTTTYNSEAIILEGSAWDTDDLVEDNWQAILRNMPGSAATTDGRLKILFKKNSDAEVLAATYSNSGNLALVGGLYTSSCTVLGTTIYAPTVYHGSNGVRNALATDSAFLKGRVSTGGNPACASDNLTALTATTDSIHAFKNAGIIYSKVNAFGTYSQAIGEVTTTDATATTVTSLTLSEAKIYKMWINCKASQGDITNINTHTFNVTCHRATGDVAVIDLQEADGSVYKSDATWGGFTIDANGNDIRVRFEGKAATTIISSAGITFL